MLFSSRNTAVVIALTSALLCLSGGFRGHIVVDAQDAAKSSSRTLKEIMLTERRFVLYNSRQLEGNCCKSKLSLLLLFVSVCCQVFPCL